MAVQFIVGRSGSGKTTFCLEAIRSELQERPMGPPLILLVPEQATFQAEYELVSTPGLSGMLRAQVLSFRRLSYRVLQETGGATRPLLDETGKKMLIYKIMHQLREQLPLFGAAAELAGFIDSMQSFFDELKRYGVTSGVLQGHIRKHERHWREHSPLFLDKMVELLRVFSAYEREMEGSYGDSEEMLALVAERASRSSLLKGAQIWIDGFNGFTPQERAVLAALFQVAADVRVTLCLDRPYGADEMPDELDLFYPTAKTMCELRQLIRESGVDEREPVCLSLPGRARFAASPPLARLEEHLARSLRSAQTSSGDRDHESKVDLQDAIRIVQAPNRLTEVQGVAREMIRLVRDHGYRWRDMAVIVRRLEDYDDVLKHVFEDYGIPCFFDVKRTVIHHPLIEFVRSAVDVVLNRWRYDDVFRCVKTDFLLSLSEDDREQRKWLDRLENEVLAHGIYGNRWHDERLWANIWEKLHESEGTFDDELSDRRPSLGQEEIERLQEARQKIIAPLLTFEQRTRRAVTVRDWIEALYLLLEEVNAQERLARWGEQCLARGEAEEAKEHVQMWERVLDVFDTMVEMIGDEPITAEQFSGMLETGLNSIRLGLVPPSLDQVLVGSMDRTRIGTVRCCFVLGANDGVIPLVQTESSVLSEPERDMLSESGLELAPGSRRKLLDEQFLIYSSLTLSKERLWISYPLADEEGKGLKPSEIIRRLQRIFPELSLRVLAAEPESLGDEEEQLEHVVAPARTLSSLIVQLRRYKNGMPISPLWWDVYHWFVSHDRWRDQLRAMAYGLFFDNRERKLSADTSRKLYGSTLTASVSRMELFVACPFAHFASYGLKLKERKVYRLEAPDIGKLFHAALKAIALDLKQNRISWADLTPDECLRLAEEAVDRLAPDLNSAILQSTKRYGYIARKLKQVVGSAASVLSEHARLGEFVPVGLEIDFGRGGTLPPLTFQLDGNRRMEVRGRIDRIDAAKGEKGTYLRIIDYKSSRTSLSFAEIFYGLSLQMLTYLDVVVTHADRWLESEVIPAGVLYFHVHNPLLSKPNRPSADEAQKEWFRRFRMSGLVLADLDAVQKMDASLEQGKRSDLIPAGLTRQGQFYKTSSVVTETEWEKLRQHTRRTIRRIGGEILEGTVEAKPYRFGNKTPCEYCVYRSVCQFDPGYEGNDYRILNALEKEEVWTAITRSQSGRQEEERS